MLWRSLKYHAVELYMKFEEIPLPREKDRLVMEIINERISSEAATRSLNRCRCYLSALFLSDITTADGKYLEQLAMTPSENGTKSRYKFPREVPTQKPIEKVAKILDGLHNNRQKATRRARKMDKPDPQNMEMVLYQGHGRLATTGEEQTISLPT